MSTKYPVTFSVTYPARDLNRLTTFFRIIVAIPILAVLSTLAASSVTSNGTGHDLMVAGSGGLLFFGPLLMIVFRQKYPRWWFDWNLELLRFSSRVGVFIALMDDRYPSTDQKQSVTLDIPYPDVENDLDQWLPLVKWLLAVPHYIVLLILSVGAVFGIIFAWFSILFTGRYPQSIFSYIEGVMRWNVRVTAFAFLLVTDEYPPFRLEA